MLDFYFHYDFCISFYSDLLVAEVNKVHEEPEVEELSQPMVAEPSLSSSMFADFDQSIGNPSEKLSAHEEVGQYFSSQIKKGNPFLFWSNSQLSRLAQVALRCLTVPATSAPVERIFSHGGLIMNARRSSLTPVNLNNILFLKCNRAYK